MLVHYSKPQCCERPHSDEKRLFPDSFLAASYFLAMILSLSGFAAILKSGRMAEDSTLLFSLGTWGINLLTWCVVSFLWSSEQDSKLKHLFGVLRETLLYGYMVTLWWPLSLTSAASEWPLVLGICGAMTLVWLRCFCGCKATAVHHAWLFLMAALCGHLGLTLLQQQGTGGAFLIWSAGLILAAFLVHKLPQTLSSDGDRQVLRELLLALSLAGNYGVIYWSVTAVAGP